LSKQSLYEISEAEFRRLQDLPCSVSTELVQIIENRSLQIFFPVLIGSSFHGLEGGSFSAGEHEYFFDGLTEHIPQECEREKVLEMAMMYLHSPYNWGGRSPFGIDCSGFTQMTYKLAGVQLLRDASQQATQGETISFISDAKPGDLLFFDDDEGMITHTGILLPENRVIHASGKVRIDNIDHQGIYDPRKGKYTHPLRMIKKIL
jgi:cell wall-associated NlpC family hydrolase